MNLYRISSISYLTLALITGISLTGCSSKSAATAPMDNNTYYEAAPANPSFMAEATADDSLSLSSDNTESYTNLPENGFIKTAKETVSTFSIDVDTASYSNVRRFITNNELPPSDAVRTEELINYFNYNYPEPTNDTPFSLSQEMISCPWNDSNKLLLIGLQGKRLAPEEIPPSNLVFLLDVSGSMSDPNKLPLLKKSFNILTSNLSEGDRISIVVYAGASGVILDGVNGNDEGRITSALESLEAGGSTAGAEGIALAYKLAEKHFIKNGNNRVILATDGDFNVGPNSESDLIRIIEKKRDKGIFLTVLGLGMGNYKDDKLESLADHGNGNYAYIDSLQEAKKVLGEELSGTLFTIAKDVKVQVDFNPNVVDSYRLIGYENRLLDKEDFNNDKVDAGDIGAGHSVTALYEIIPSKPLITTDDKLKYYTDTTMPIQDEYGLVKLRYKKPDANESQLITTKFSPQLTHSSENINFAAGVAEYSMLLRDSSYKGNASLEQVLSLIKPYAHEDTHKSGFYDLVMATQPLLLPSESNALSSSIDASSIINAYMDIIDMLYTEDTALNDDISILAIDTSTMCNITSYEKSCLIARLEQFYGLEVIDDTFDNLCQNGFIKKDELYFPNGIFIQIEDTPLDTNSSFNFNASKWRSGLGAVGYNNASIMFEHDTWLITTNEMWVS